MILAKFLLNVYAKGDPLEITSYVNNILLNETINSLLEQSDPNFKKKFGIQVQILGMLLVIKNTSSNHSIFRKKVSEARLNLSSLYLTDRQFYATKANLLVVIESYRNRLSQHKFSNIPPKRYIGVGYKDKGSRRIISFDGSPSWQEIASSSRLENDPYGFRNYDFIDEAINILHNNRSIYEDSKDWILLLKKKLDSAFSSRV